MMHRLRGQSRGLRAGHPAECQMLRKRSEEVLDGDNVRLAYGLVVKPVGFHFGRCLLRVVLCDW